MRGYTGAMHWQLHNLTITGDSNSPELLGQWQRSFASLPSSRSPADIVVQLDLVEQVDAEPDGQADFRQGDFLSYYLSDDTATAHFPRFGQLYLDLAKGTTHGRLVHAALDTYGVLEDMVAIALSPHLRRRGYFLLHAFAAALDGKALLLVGDIGAGKTTSGIALLAGGWKLLSNDSPIIAANGQVLQYPGVLAAYPETFARFEQTAAYADGPSKQQGRKKRLLPAEKAFGDVWRAQATAGAICFPIIENRPDHLLEPIGAAETLRRLLPNAIEQWDRAMMGPHLSVLRQLADCAPAYVLRLGPDVHRLADVLRKAVS